MRAFSATVALVLSATPPLAVHADDHEAYKRVAMFFGTGKFAAETCPGMTYDAQGITNAHVANGLADDDLGTGEMKPLVAAWMNLYRSDMSKSINVCGSIWQQFGPKGTKIPGLLRRPR
jgi:hypothetical protein